MDAKTREAMKIIYDFLSVSENPRVSDAIFVAGGSTIGPAIKAAELFKKGFAKKIFMTAKKGTFSNSNWKDDDALVYKKKMLEMQIPEDSIICQPISANSLEEADDSIYLMRQDGLNPKLVIIVDRPVHQRREFATFLGLFPEIKFINCPADEPIEYKQAFLDREVAEMDRIDQYALQGILAKQIFSEKVMNAYNFLKLKISDTFGSRDN